ncbi:MAG: RNA polymerase sigma factor [Acidimicrobiales bacterium]
MTDHQIAQVFAQEWSPLVALLVRDLGDLGLAEDAAQEAFARAATRWVAGTMPDRPGAWLLTTARRAAIDMLRRRSTELDRLDRLGSEPDLDGSDPATGQDAQLAMLMGCCHPSLAPAAQTALTLRYVAGLTTAQIARAFLVPEVTMAKRLVRAKAKIRAAAVPFAVPRPEDLGDRLAVVLGVIYLIFTEGHTSSDSPSLVRGDLCDEAAWLAEHLSSMLPDEPEPLGLAALIAFTDARRASRTDAAGDVVLLEAQDRTQWDAVAIAGGHRRLEQALLMGRPGPYQLQAAIAAVHASARTFADTDWAMIVRIYRDLYQLEPSPVVWLNQAVAVAMVDSPARGLDLIDALGDTLDDYAFLHSSRAELHRRLGRLAAAVAGFERALSLTESAPQQRFLRQQIADISPLVQRGDGW